MAIRLSALPAASPALLLARLRQPAPWLRLLIALLALLLCWLTAGVAARLLGSQGTPPALAHPAAPAQDPHSALRTLGSWFSEAPASADAAPPPDNLRLIAVIAGDNGVALIAGIEPEVVAVAAGEEARPGLRLVEVLPDKVILEHGGARRELAFPATPTVSPAPAAATSNLIRPAPPRVQPIPRQTSQIARGQLSGIVQRGNLANWDKGLAPFPEGGIRVTSVAEQPLAQILKLRDGDVVKRVNGREVKALPDISLLYHHFSQSPEVELVVLRDGKQQNLTFKIQP